eukprot:4759115-Ditylum_brightwellii.AAC.1
MSNATYHFDNEDHQNDDANTIKTTGVNAEGGENLLDPIKTIGVESHHHEPPTSDSHDDRQDSDGDAKPTESE